MGARGRDAWLPLEVDARDQSDDEPMGTKDKFWIDVQDGHWLVKLCRVVGGETRGEDWSEWLVHRLAVLLGVPTAITEPATVLIDAVATRIRRRQRAKPASEPASDFRPAAGTRKGRARGTRVQRAGLSR